MEKSSKKSKQLCLGLLKPSVMLLTTGFLSMAFSPALASVEPAANHSL